MSDFYSIAVYPFLFVALFFEVFLILTYFDAESIRRRIRRTLTNFPTVSVIVPSYNEAKTVGATIRSLIELDYPKQKLSLILVDDGSHDETPAVLSEYAHLPYVTIVRKENGGKHTALNEGIRVSTSEFVACLDADSFVSKNALREILPHFDAENIGAVTSSMSISRPRLILERIQQAEYLLGILLRHVLSTINGLHVTPGPFTVYRRSVFDSIGLFRPAHNTEDMEIALRMQKHGWHIQNAPRARVYTKAPKTLRALLKQRVRWTTGFIRNSVDYRDLYANPKYGALGLLVLPLGALSIISGVTLFIVSLVEFSFHTWDIFVKTSSVPLSFLFRPPAFDLFFVPMNALIALTSVAIIITVAFIIAGARISKTRARLSPALIWYVPLYGLIAPLWLVRSIFDVVFNIRRAWR